MTPAGQTVLYALTLIAVAAYVFAPLLSGARRGWGEAEPAGAPLELQQLIARRDAALRALRDLEEEAALGKLSPADHESLRADYMRLAAQWIGQVDRFEQKAER